MASNGNAFENETLLPIACFRKNPLDVFISFENHFERIVERFTLNFLSEIVGFIELSKELFKMLSWDLGQYFVF